MRMGYYYVCRLLHMAHTGAAVFTVAASKYPRKPNEQMLTPLVTQLMQNQMLQHNG